MPPLSRSRSGFPSKHSLFLVILLFTVSTLFLYYYSIDNPERDLQSGQFGVIRQELLRTVSSLRSVCSLIHGPFVFALSSFSYQFVVDLTPACSYGKNHPSVAVVFETYFLDKPLTRSVFKGSASVSTDNLRLHSRIQSRRLLNDEKKDEKIDKITDEGSPDEESIVPATVTKDNDPEILSTIHTAVIDNLENEQYYYTIAILLSHDGTSLQTSSPIVWKHTGSTVLLDPTTEPSNTLTRSISSLPTQLRIGYISDSQSGASIYRSLLASLGKLEPGIDLLIHGGDGIQDSGSIRELTLYSLSPIQLYYSLFYPSRVPSLLFIHGNHDNPLRIQSYANYRTYKVLQYYNYVRFIIIDSELSNDKAQEQYLHQVCTGKHPDVEHLSIPYFTIVIVHIAPYIEYWDPFTWNDASTQDKQWNTWVREQALPILLSNRCITSPDLVISGHSHIYQRGNRHPSFHSRPYYIIAGGGGGELETTQVHDWNMYNNRTYFYHHYGTLTIDTSRTVPQLLWEVFDTKGRMFDSLKLPSLYSKRMERLLDYRSAKPVT